MKSFPSIDEDLSWLMAEESKLWWAHMTESVDLDRPLWLEAQDFINITYRISY